MISGPIEPSFEGDFVSIRQGFIVLIEGKVSRATKKRLGSLFRENAAAQVGL